MASSTTRTPRSDLIRKATSSRVDWSDQCRSSSTSSKRPPGAEPAQQPQDELEQLGYLEPVGGRLVSWFWASTAPGSSSGSRRPRPRRAGPSTSASSARAVVRASVRSASMSGASGRPSAPSSTQWPASTVNPESAACPASSVTRRVLPTPASPATIAKPGSPPAARSQQRGQRLDLLAPPDEDRALDRLAHTLHGATTGAGAGTGYWQHQHQQALSTPGGRAEPGGMTTTTDSLVREQAAGAARGRWLMLIVLLAAAVHGAARDPAGRHVADLRSGLATGPPARRSTAGASGLGALSRAPCRSAAARGARSRRRQPPGHGTSAARTLGGAARFTCAILVTRN